jgi:hypothetical protein
MANEATTKTTKTASKKILSDVSAKTNGAAVKTTVQQPVVETLTHLQPVAADVKVSRSMEYMEKGKIRVTGTVRFNEKSLERYYINSVYDFSKCTDAEILELAASSVRITIQARIRTIGETALQTKPFAMVDVKSEVVDAAKTTVDDITKSIRSLARALKMPEEDARRIIERELSNKSRS